MEDTQNTHEPTLTPRLSPRAYLPGGRRGSTDVNGQNIKTLRGSIVEAWKETMEKPSVLVMEVPAGLSVGEIQQLVNAPLEDGGYYFAGVAPYGPGAIAFFRLKVEKVQAQAADEDAALAILKANPRLSCAKMTALLAAHNIKRGSQWVYTRRAELEMDAGPSKR